MYHIEMMMRENSFLFSRHYRTDEEQIPAIDDDVILHCVLVCFTLISDTTFSTLVVISVLSANALMHFAMSAENIFSSSQLLSAILVLYSFTTKYCNVFTMIGKIHRSCTVVVEPSAPILFRQTRDINRTAFELLLFS